MRPYAVFIDAGSDLTPALGESLDIGYVPMELTLDGETRLCSITDDHEQDCHAFYDELRAGKEVKTSQISPFLFEQTFGPLLETGIDILYGCFSSGISATWNSAQVAREQLQAKYPDRILRFVDTYSASGGGSVAGVYMARNRDAGMDIEANAKWLEANALSICHWFTVGDLDFLKRGGRISPTVAFVGGMLNIKPLLIIKEDGSLAVTGKARGRKAAMQQMVGNFKSHLRMDDAAPVIFVSHAGCPEDVAVLSEMVREAAPADAEIHVVPLSPILGSHTGPDMMAICHLGTDGR